MHNIIFASGSIPPMTASLVSVTNGYETYVYTDRVLQFCDEKTDDLSL